MTSQPVESTIHTVPRARIPSTPYGGVGVQKVLLGAARADNSPMLLGITEVRAGLTTPLIQHDTAEIAYVLCGEGWMMTNNTMHPFTPGDAILIDPGCWHSIRAGQETVEMLYVFSTATPPPTRSHPSSLP